MRTARLTKSQVILNLQKFNTFLTMQEIADRAALRLTEKFAMPGLVYSEPTLDGMYGNKGLVVQVRKPATFTAVAFSSTISAEAITESSVNVTLDKIADVSVAITSKEMTCNIDDFQYQVIDGAMVAIAKQIQDNLLGLYTEVYSFSGTSGTAASALANIANAAQKLDEQYVPDDMRNAVWSPASVAGLRQVAGIVNALNSGTTETLRKGTIGTVYGIDNYGIQTVPTHTAGGYTALADVKIASTAGTKAAVLTSTAGSSSAALVVGDLIQITGGSQHVVTAASGNASSGVVTIAIEPAMPTTHTATAITFPDVTYRSHKANLVFHRNWAALVSKPMFLPADKDSAYATWNGMTVRVVRGYDMSTKTDTISFDVLYGVKVMDNRLATIALG